MISKKLAVIALSLVSLNAFTLELGLSPYAKHFNSDIYPNETINLISVSHKGIGALTMVNSFGDRSFGLFYKSDFFQRGRIGASLMLGVMSGYHDGYLVHERTKQVVKKGQAITVPIIAPSISYRVGEKTKISVTQQINATAFGLEIQF